MIDWAMILLKIRRHLGMARTAKRISSNEDHLNRIIRGEVQQPKFNTGIEIIKLHNYFYPDDQVHFKI